ncbi:MAG: Ig-like domain-containing protein [Pseudonocardiaceae bacterium]
MRTSKLITRLAAGAVVLAVAGSGALVAVANAQEPPSSGTVTITPATGTDLNAPTGTTSGPCDAVAADATTSDGYAAFLSGPGVFTPNAEAGRPFGVSVAFGTAAPFSKTAAFTFPFRLNFNDLASEQGAQDLVPGDYVLTVQCTDSFLGTVFQTFTGGLRFTTATTYEADNPTPTPVVTPTPTPVVTPTPTVTSTPRPGATATTTRLSVIQIPLPFKLGGFAIPIANVAPTNATGTVQFKDGDTNIGGPVRVVNGTAIGPFTFLPRGQHSVTAVFTPRNPAAFRPSTSNTVRFRF